MNASHHASSQDQRPDPGRNSLWSECIRRFVFPLYEWQNEPRVFRLYRELKQQEFLRPDQVAEIQSQRLGRLLTHAAGRVPYYREMFRQAGVDASRIRNVEDLARIPILTKTTLQEQQLKLVTEGLDVKRLKWNASGGSTGRPVQLYQDDTYWAYARANWWFLESWWGILPGESRAALWGADRDLGEQGWKEKLAYWILQVRVCNVFAVTEQQLEKFARELQSWQPAMIAGYASALHLMARFLMDHPEYRIRPRAIKSTAETLFARERELIENAFQAPVYDFYGSREVNNLAAECPAHRGLHVNALTRVIEVVDDLGQPVGPGIPGRLIVTDLTNLAMPIIRYEIEDIGKWAGDPCPCGRPFPLLAQVMGRKSDFIPTPSGKLIHGEFFTHLFYDLEEVAQFQAVQEVPGELIVQVVLRPGADTAVLNRLERKLRDSLGLEMVCRIERVERIERSPSGKHRFTVSRVPVSWGTRPSPARGGNQSEP